MKIKNLAIATALFASVATFAQKDQLKAAEKSLKSGNAAEAKEILAGIENMIVNADESQKAQYHFLKGNASFELAKKNVEVDKNLAEAAKAYSDLMLVEENSGKVKYTTQAQTSLTELKEKVRNSAIADIDAKKFKTGALKLYQTYSIDKKDTVMLYYAANYALNAQDYDLALDYYKKLKDVKYSGKATNYTAKFKANDEEQTFLTLAQRDQAVKIGTHYEPKTEHVPSKRGEIAKNISLLYIQKGDVPAAKKSMGEARANNPEDVSLILSEADLYLQTKDYEMYKKLVSEALAKNPNNADLYYNLGVISSQSEDKQAKVDAEGYYLKAIEIDPKYKNAYINLSALKLEGEKEIVDAMNKLGTSDADNKKYDVLKAKRATLYKSVIPFLEKAHELLSDDQDIKTTLLNMYYALDMTDKAKALKAKK